MKRNSAMAWLAALTLALTLPTTLVAARSRPGWVPPQAPWMGTPTPHVPPVRQQNNSALFLPLLGKGMPPVPSQTLLPPTPTLTRTAVPPTPTQTLTPVPPTATPTATLVPPTPTPTRTPWPPGAFAVGLVTDVGTIVDGTFNESAFIGMMKAANEFGLFPAYIETQSDLDYERNIEQFAAQDYDMIVTVGFRMNDATAAMAEKYPHIRFAGVDQTSDQSNFAGLLFAEDHAGFLAGCLAGLMTSSNTIGFVGGMEVPPVVRFRAGYENGARYVNGDVEVLGVYLGSFVDPAAGRGAALAQIALGADVIFAAAGATGAGSLLAATSVEVWAIGVDVDEYLTTFGQGTVAGANKLLSSALKRTDVGVYSAIRAARFGPWTGGSVLFDATQDGVGLAPYHEAEAAIPQAVKDRLAQIMADMRAGWLPTSRLRPPAGASR